LVWATLCSATLILGDAALSGTPLRFFSTWQSGSQTEDQDTSCPSVTQSSPMMFLIHVMVRGSTFGRFQKYWYPQIIHFNRVFYYKPSILGCPYFLETPISTHFNRSTSSVMSLTAHEIALRPGSFAGYLGPWVPLHGHLSRLAAHFTEG